MAAIEDRLKDQAERMGFDLVGIAAASPADGFERFRDWLDRGYAGEMEYMSRHAAARRDPSSILSDVRSVIVVGMNYFHDSASAQLPVAAGKVARYARAADYHDVLRERLRHLLAWLSAESPQCRGRAVVDTAPLLERDFARRAGLGWFGKNTMLLNRRIGSYFFLGALLVNLELRPDPAHDTDHCGTCTACLDACPTQAFVQPRQLDARRCISYLTIELRGSIPEEQRSSLDDWLFGCDVCQEVCPWNHKAPATREAEFQSGRVGPALDPCELLALSEEDFRKLFRGTALTRAKRSGLLRNAAIVLGNRGEPTALPALTRATHDHDPAVQEAAQWAADRIRARFNLSPLPPVP